MDIPKWGRLFTVVHIYVGIRAPYTGALGTALVDAHKKKNQLFIIELRGA